MPCATVADGRARPGAEETGGRRRAYGVRPLAWSYRRGPFTFRVGHGEAEETLTGRSRENGQGPGSPSWALGRSDRDRTTGIAAGELCIDRRGPAASPRAGRRITATSRPQCGSAIGSACNPTFRRRRLGVSRPSSRTGRISPGARATGTTTPGMCGRMGDASCPTREKTCAATTQRNAAPDNSWWILSASRRNMPRTQPLSGFWLPRTASGSTRPR